MCSANIGQERHAAERGEGGSAMALIDCTVPLRYHRVTIEARYYLWDAALCNLKPTRHTDLVHSPTVFGNGRTHSGGLEGSGGSRLANNWLRAWTRHPPSQVSSQELGLYFMLLECVFFLQAKSPVQAWVLQKVRAGWSVEGVVVGCVSDCRRSSEAFKLTIPTSSLLQSQNIRSSARTQEVCHSCEEKPQNKPHTHREGHVPRD